MIITKWPVLQLPKPSANKQSPSGLLTLINIKMKVIDLTDFIKNHNNDNENWVECFCWKNIIYDQKIDAVKTPDGTFKINKWGPFGDKINSL